MVEGPKIKGGYILLSRKLIESKIFKKPPLYLKVWIYLLSRAQHKKFKNLKEGELWTSIPEIQEACSWYVGYRKVTPTYKEVYSVINWLKEPHERICERTTNGNTNRNMIVTTKGTQGMLVNIENYRLYQEPKNYEGNSEGNTERTTKELRTELEGNNINKNVTRMYKNEQEYINNNKEDVKNPLSVYQNNIYPLPGIMEVESIQEWSEYFGAELVIYSIEIAAKNNVRNWKYIERILIDWDKKGIKDLQQAKAYSSSRKGARKTNDQNRRDNKQNEVEYDFNIPYTEPTYNGEIEF